MVVDKFGRGPIRMVTDKFGRATKRRFVDTLSNYGDEAHDVDFKRLARVGDPEDSNDAVTVKYLQQQFLEKLASSGEVDNTEIINIRDDLTRFKNNYNNFNKKRLVAVGEPVAADDGATKVYVDQKDAITKQQIRSECNKIDKRLTDVKKQLETQLEEVKEAVKIIELKKNLHESYINTLYDRLQMTRPIST